MANFSWYIQLIPCTTFLFHFSRRTGKVSSAYKFHRHIFFVGDLLIFFRGSSSRYSPIRSSEEYCFRECYKIHSLKFTCLMLEVWGNFLFNYSNASNLAFWDLKLLCELYDMNKMFSNNQFGEVSFFVRNIFSWHFSKVVDVLKRSTFRIWLWRVHISQLWIKIEFRH